jgi:hypothetical protein
MRITRHHFEALNLPFLLGTSARCFVKNFVQVLRSLYTTPSGLYSPQTPDIVSQSQRHCSTKNQKTRYFDNPV